MKFHTVKASSVVDRAETIQDLIAKKQRRADNKLGTSANEPQVVYAPIGQLVVKEIEEAPAPIKVGDVYTTRGGRPCRIIVTDRKGAPPIIGLVQSSPPLTVGGITEYACYYYADGSTTSHDAPGTNYDLILPTTRRKIVEFIAATPHKDSCKVEAFCPVTGTFKEWDLGDYPGF